MKGIIFQIVVVVFLVGLLCFVALDDRRSRAQREQEEAEERDQADTPNDHQQ